jgi:dihydrofolate synthase / folylpolyglutamate synthase
MHEPDLAEWLNKLTMLHPRSIDLSLERIKEVATRLSIWPIKCPVITVAGTNGKGSCVTLLESILLAAGYRAGAYFSPHLIHFNERIRYQGSTATDAEICSAFSRIEHARNNISLTYFEFATLAAILIFQQQQLDVWILEVGLGGRLDAVNIFDADVAMISTIALDHTDWLGNTREKIGFEKAGIIRAHKPVICGDFAVPESIQHYAAELKAPLYCQTTDFAYSRQDYYWMWWNREGQLTDLPLLQFELQNAATVLQAIHHLPQPLKVSVDAIRQGLQQARLPGRFQIIPGKIVQILDVAHNPAAGELLAKRLATEPCSGHTLAVVAMLADKDRQGTLTPLLSLVDKWYVASLNIPRGGEAADLAAILKNLGAEQIHEHAEVEAAYQACLAAATEGDRILIFGSFYTVAAVLKVLER